MRFNKNAKLIPLAVLGLGLVAAVGMYLRVEQMGQSSGGGSPYASVAATAVPSPQIPGNWPIVTPGNDPQSTWLKTLNEEYRGTFVGLDRGVIAIAWPVTKEQSDALKAMGTGYDFWAGFPMLFTSVLGSATTTENGIDKVYLLTQTQWPNVFAHSEQALLGGAVLSDNGPKWSVERLQRYVTLGGTFGAFGANITVINIGKNHPAFQVRDVSTYQGNTNGNLSLYAYANGSFRNVVEGVLGDDRDSFHIERLSFNDRINQVASSVETTFEPIPSARDYYDLKATKTETTYFPVWNKATFGGVWKVTGVTRTVDIYSFNGEEYVRKSGP